MADAENNALHRLGDVFRDVFDDDTLSINEQTIAADVEGWDSLAHIRLIVSIEKAFSLRFSASEIAALDNVGDMAKLIVSKQPIL
jgi:acyl carrier protein